MRFTKIMEVKKRLIYFDTSKQIQKFIYGIEL